MGSFVEMWMDLESVIQSKVNQTEEDKYHMMSLMWNLIFKNDTNELIYKTETDLQMLKTNLWLPMRKHGEARDKLGIWD